MTVQKNQLSATDDVSRPASRKLSAIHCSTSSGNALPLLSRFFMNRDSRSSDGVALRAAMVSVMNWSTTARLLRRLCSLPMPSAFLIRHRKLGNRNLCMVAKVASSKALAKGFSVKPGDSVSGSLPKVSPQMLSKVRRSRRSWRSTLAAASQWSARMRHRRSLMERLAQRAMAWRSVRVVNSSAAVLRWSSQVSPSELKMPWPRRSWNAACHMGPLG
uniref:Uncharacterized protein n=1 Tax=Triticum urartu TaxID=4572 RepID=A0A8R7TZN5_TRIUA